VIVSAGPGWTQIVTAIATAVAALGLGAAARGVFLARQSLQEEVKTRHAQIALDLGSRWDSKETGKVKQLIAEQLTSGFDADDLYRFMKVQEELNSNNYYRLERFANFFEEVAILWRLDILSLEWIDLTLGDSVTGYWRIWALAVASEQNDYPRAYENWQKLAAELSGRGPSSPS